MIVCSLQHCVEQFVVSLALDFTCLKKKKTILVFFFFITPTQPLCFTSDSQYSIKRNKLKSEHRNSHPVTSANHLRTMNKLLIHFEFQLTQVQIKVHPWGP